MVFNWVSREIRQLLWFGFITVWDRQSSLIAGRKIAPNTGANATKFFMLATKSWKLVAKLATRISNHTFPRNLGIVEEDKSAAKFLVKLVSITQHMHDFERKYIVTRYHLGFR